MGMESWLPAWLGALWVAVFAVVAVVHVVHLSGVGAWAQAWHGGHVLMALGIISMYWPDSTGFVPASEGEIAFAVLAVAAAAAALSTAVQGRWSILWTISALDFAIMVYMFAMPKHRQIVLTLVLAAWLLVEACFWITGWLGRSSLPGSSMAGLDVGPGDAERRTGDLPVASAGRASTSGGGLEASSAVATRTRPRPLAGREGTVHAASVAVTLAVMAIGMGYMLLAMQFGMAMPMQAPGMMPGMPGM